MREVARAWEAAGIAGFRPGGSYKRLADWARPGGDVESRGPFRAGPDARAAGAVGAGSLWSTGRSPPRTPCNAFALASLVRIVRYHRGAWRARAGRYRGPSRAGDHESAHRHAKGRERAGPDPQAAESCSSGSDRPGTRSRATPSCGSGAPGSLAAADGAARRHARRLGVRRPRQRCRRPAPRPR